MASLTRRYLCKYISCRSIMVFADSLTSLVKVEDLRTVARETSFVTCIHHSQNLFLKRQYLV